MNNVVTTGSMTHRLVSSGRCNQYADKVSVYIVIVPESTTEDEIREYCTTRVEVCHHDKNSERMFYESYYELRKINKNTYQYTVTKPYVN